MNHERQHMLDERALMNALVQEDLQRSDLKAVQSLSRMAREELQENRRLKTKLTRALASLRSFDPALADHIEAQP